MVRKVVPIIIIFAFFTDLLVIPGNAWDHSTSGGKELNSSQIAVSSIFNDLTGIQHKDIGRVKLSLEACFGTGARIDMKALRAVGEKYRDSIFDGANFFFHEVEPLGNGYSSLKCRLNDKKNGIRTYIAVFSTDKASLEGFPIEVFTQDEWLKGKDRIKESINSGRALSSITRSYHKPSDERAIQRYVLHEKGVDTVIRSAAQKGFVKKPLASRFDYKRSVEDLLEELRVKVRDTPGLVRPEDREFYVVKKTAEVQEKMRSLPKPIVVDNETGKEYQVEYSAHSSNNAVYVFVDEKDFDQLTDETVLWPAAAIDSEIEKRIPSKTDIMEMSDEEILNLFDPRYGELKKHVWNSWVYAKFIGGMLAKVMDFKPEQEQWGMLRVACLLHDLGGRLGYGPHDQVEIDMIKKARAKGIRYLPRVDHERETVTPIGPSELLAEFENKGIDLSEEEKRVLPSLDHPNRTITEMEKIGIDLPPEVKNVIENHWDGPPDFVWNEWDTVRKWMELSLIVADGFEGANNYYKRKVLGSAEYESIQETLDFLKERQFRKRPEELGDLSTLEEEVKKLEEVLTAGNGITELEKLVKFSRTPIQFTRFGPETVNGRLESRIAHELGVMFGLNTRITDDGSGFISVENDMDERYRFLRSPGLKGTATDTFDETIKVSTTDLDKTLASRDYAAAVALERTKADERLTQIARDVGVRIAPPVKDLTLFMSEGFYRDKQEFTADRDVYGDRFRLELIRDDDPSRIADKVIAAVEEKGIRPADVIVQFTAELGKERYGRSLSRLRARGIRYLIVDNGDMGDDKEKRRGLRRDIYVIMLLTRVLGRDPGIDREAYDLLDLFMKPYLGKIESETLSNYDFIFSSGDASESVNARGMYRFLADVMRFRKRSVYDLVLEKWDEIMFRQRKGEGRVFNYDLDNIKRDHKPGAKLTRMYNPGRAAKRGSQVTKMDSVKERYDESKFQFNKAREEEVIVDVTLDGVRCDVLVNTNPFMRGHILITPERERGHNQYFRGETAKVMLEMLRTADRKSFKIAYNSVGAFASINHLHIQAMEYQGLGGKMPVEREERELLFEESGVLVSTLPGWLVRTLVLESADKKSLNDQLLRLIRTLHTTNTPFNIMGTYDGGIYTIYVYPRKFQSSKLYGTGVAYMELSGEMALVDSDKDFRKIEEKELQNAIMKEGLDEEEFLNIVGWFRIKSEAMAKRKKVPARDIVVPQKAEYMFLLPSAFFKEKELSLHRQKYREFFKIAVVGGNGREFVDNAITQSDGKGNRAVLLVPDDIGEDDLARITREGIRFIRVDKRSLVEAQKQGADERDSFQNNVYRLMLLVRCINGKTREDSTFYDILKTYLKHLVQLDNISPEEYVDAIRKGDITRLVKGLLLYRPMTQYRPPEYDTAVAALLSA